MRIVGRTVRAQTSHGVGRSRRLLWLGLMAGGLAVGTRPATASPSGLNNTPTADTCSERTVVLQGWSGFGHEQNPDWWTGLKLSPFKNAEIGVDWKADDDPSRHAEFQVKYGIDLNDVGTRLGLGIANVSDSRPSNGEPFPYAVLTQDVKGWFRIHAGYDFQEDNKGAFGGIDRTVPLLGRDVMLCADAIQINDQEDMLFAPGIKFGLGHKGAEGESVSAIDKVLQHVVFETWTTFTTEPHKHQGYVAKLNLVFGF